MSVVMNRRESLKLLGLSAAALGTNWATAAVGKPEKWKTAVGLNGFQSGARKYKKNYPIWEVLDFATRHRFDGVELVADWPSGGYPGAKETDRVRALRRLYEDFGLKIFSIQSGADGAFAPEEATRSQWLETFRDRAGLAKQLGCDCIGLWPYGGLRGQTLEDALSHLIHSFREAGKVAGDLGLTAAFEIEPPFVFNTELHYLRILQGANHPALKGIYDPSHFDLMTGSSDKAHEMLERVGVQNIGYIHLTDTDGTLREGGTSKHLGCGDGHLDIARSLRILRQGGFRSWIMIDEWEVPDPYDACVKGKHAIDAAWPD